MRPIPPEIWALAQDIGQMQRVFDETGNTRALRVMALMQQKIEQFLEQTRKGK